MGWGVSWYTEVDVESNQLHDGLSHHGVRGLASVDEDINWTYIASVLRLVCVNNRARHNYKRLLRGALWILSGPFIVLK